jgi:phosphoribosylanthranilate isomerase
MMVKICGITNRDDAQAAVDHGASALGFIFYPRSPRYVSPEQAAEIIAGLGSRVWNVGVFVDEPGDRVSAVMSQAGLDIAQLHGDESPSDYPAGARVWKAWRIRGAFDPAEHQNSSAEAVLLDGPATGVSFDWTMAAQMDGKVIVAGGLDESNVREAIDRAKPWGVDASSRLEYAPGKKDHIKLQRFLKAALK